jgi:hypothetical protein
MKTLLFVLLIVFASCEKDNPEETIQRTCWECKYIYSVAVPMQVRNFCDGTDIGLTSGEITETQINQYEATNYIQGVLTVRCTAFKEK